MYNTYRVDSNGVETLISVSDTLRIVGDTTMNGNTYTIKQIISYNGIVLSNEFIRDSSGYIVTAHGDIKYSYIDFEHIIHTDSIDPFLSFYIKMQNKVSVSG